MALGNGTDTRSGRSGFSRDRLILWQKWQAYVFSTILLLILAPSPAQAMHISEGILPFAWAGLWSLAALPFIVLGLRRLRTMAQADLSAKPLLGLMTAAVFIISCMPIPVPTAGTCSHPAGTGIAAILVGPLVSIVIAAVALLIQALFMAHGGLSTWGANVLAMGVAGSCAAWGIFRLARRCGLPLGPAAFFAGIAADWATYLATSGILAAGIRGNEPFWPLAGQIVLAFVPTQLPLGILEGAMTAGMVTLLARKRPDLLVRMRVIPAAAALALLLIAGAFLAPPAKAAQNWSGVDETVVEKIANAHGRESRAPLLDTDRGDLLLFVFLAAGAVGGFGAGYAWRMLTERKGAGEGG